MLYRWYILSIILQMAQNNEELLPFLKAIWINFFDSWKRICIVFFSCTPSKSPKAINGQISALRERRKNFNNQFEYLWFTLPAAAPLVWGTHWIRHLQLLSLSFQTLEESFPVSPTPTAATRSLVSSINLSVPKPPPMGRCSWFLALLPNQKTNGLVNVHHSNC